MDYGKLQFGPGKLKIHTYRLESVGTLLTYDGVIYPMGADGSDDGRYSLAEGYMWNNSNHLENIEPDGDWMTSLSVEDRKTVDSVMASPNYRAHIAIHGHLYESQAD